MRNGTAIPINDTGPANAVTHADNMLDKTIIIILHFLTLIPTLLAYSSPSLSASNGLHNIITRKKDIPTINNAYKHPVISLPEKLP